MSSNNTHEKIIKDLRKQRTKVKKIRINMEKEKDSIKKEKLREKLKTAYKNLMSKIALEKERTAFNTPPNTPVKSKKNRSTEKKNNGTK